MGTIWFGRTQYQALIKSLILGILCIHIHGICIGIVSKVLNKFQQGMVFVPEVNRVSLLALPWSVEAKSSQFKKRHICYISWQHFQPYSLNNKVPLHVIQHVSGSLGRFNKVKVKQCWDPWRSMRNSIEHLISSFEYAPLMQALWLGDISDLDQVTYDRFLRSGLLPTLVISGAHLGLLASWLRRFLQWALQYLRRQYLIQDIIISLITFIYISMIGFGMASYRAWSMIVCYPIMRLLDRPLTTEGVFHWSMRISLGFQPHLMFEKGFVVSAMFVAMLIHFRSILQHPIFKDWVFWLISLPLQIGYFGQVLGVGCLFSVVLSGVMMLCYSLISLMIIVYWVIPGNIYWYVGMIIDILLGFILKILEDGSYLLGSISVSISLEWTWLIIWFQYCCFHSLAEILTCIIVMIFYVLYRYAVVLPVGCIKWQVYDVGHGLNVIIETANHVMMFDTGGRYYQKELSATWYVKQHHVDLLLISHADEDHRGNINVVKKLFKSTIVHNGQLNIGHTIHQGNWWLWDGVLFEVMYSSSDNSSSNDRSLVLRVTDDKQQIWLMGDVSQKVERLLAHNVVHSKGYRTNLVVSHHGSATSSDPEWLAKIKPQVSIISSGRKYNLPNKYVVTRLSKWGKVHITKVNGMFDSDKY